MALLCSNWSAVLNNISSSCWHTTSPVYQKLARRNQSPQVHTYASNLPEAHQKLDTGLICGAGSLQALELLPTKPGDQFDLVRDLDCLLPVEVQEQRLSNLLQSLLVAVCLRELSPSPPLHPFEPPFPA